MKCKNCSTQFDETTESRCPHCGAAVLPQNPAQESQADTSEGGLSVGANLKVGQNIIPQANPEEVGLSAGAWIGGILWAIIGFGCGIIPGILVIWLMVSAYNKKGFARSFLKGMNIFLIVCFMLSCLVCCLAVIGASAS